MVPETLEPSLQLASAVLSELKMPQEEVAQAIQTFRKTHISDLQVGPALTGGEPSDSLPTHEAGSAMQDIDAVLDQGACLLDVGQKICTPLCVCHCSDKADQEAQWTLLHHIVYSFAP